MLRLRQKGIHMTPQKVLETIATYRKLFEEAGTGKIDYLHDELLTTPDLLSLPHCHGMLDKMEEFVRDKRIEKVMRWLGFVQGVLWVQGVYTLENLKSHN